MPRCKTPSTDGLPADFYVVYVDVLSDKLSEVSGKAREAGVHIQLLDGCCLRVPRTHNGRDMDEWALAEDRCMQEVRMDDKLEEDCFEWAGMPHNFMAPDQ
ncbi:hypothetical protein NDU88_004514 [Pleurodeles waltl]|uniref:Uncharacterized protein n=1 Tax=Pleurodeles waltl TaxID=8319 RepID=A0AAV7WW11_PLEWA|nr:hypothetical protein NDU88_004514 [Pleurodeles waltl]